MGFFCGLCVLPVTQITLLSCSELMTEEAFVALASWLCDASNISQTLVIFIVNMALFYSGHLVTKLCVFRQTHPAVAHQSRQQ